MTPTTLFTALIVVVAIVWLSIKQTSWTPVRPNRALRAPLVLLAVGAFSLLSDHREAVMGAGELGALLLEIVLSVIVGAAIGLIAHIRPLPAETGGSHREAAAFETRNGGWGLALWLLLIAIRIGIMIWLSASGVDVFSTPATLLIGVAANRLARTGVILARLGSRVSPAAAQH